MKYCINQNRLKIKFIIHCRISPCNELPRIVLFFGYQFIIILHDYVLNVQGGEDRRTAEASYFNSFPFPFRSYISSTIESFPLLYALKLCHQLCQRISRSDCLCRNHHPFTHQDQIDCYRFLSLKFATTCSPYVRVFI